MPAWQRREHADASAAGNPPSRPPKPKPPGTCTTPAGPPLPTSPAPSAYPGPPSTGTSRSTPSSPPAQVLDARGSLLPAAVDGAAHPLVQFVQPLRPRLPGEDLVESD